MFSDFYFSCLDRNKNIMDSYNLTPAVPKSIAQFRADKKVLLNDILAWLDSCPDTDEKLALQKLALGLCSQICETRISSDSKKNCLIIQPDITDRDLRDFCVNTYDMLLAEIKAVSSMYIPDPMERTEPDKDKRAALMRIYDMKQNQEKMASQANNRNLNKLFGSRG